MASRLKQLQHWSLPNLIAWVALATSSVAEIKLHDWPGVESEHLQGVESQAVRVAHLVQVGHVQLTPDPTYKVGERPQLTDLYVIGNHAFIGSFHNVLYIVDISDPANLRQVAQVTTSDPPVDVKVAGDLALVGLQLPSLDAGGLLVLDISDPRQPRKLAEVDLDHAGGVHNLFIHRERAYLAHSTSRRRGLTIVDLKNPSAPVISGGWEGTAGFSNVIHDVFIADGMAFLSDILAGQGGLIILDLSNLDRPKTLGTLAVPEGLHSAWKTGTYVYCNQEFGGGEQLLRVVDVANPQEPKLVGAFRADLPLGEAFLGPHNPFVRDGLLYWAYYDAGVRVFDLTRPEQPMEIAYNTAPFAWGAHPHTDGFVYATDSGRGGVMAFQLTLEGNTAVEGEGDITPSQVVLEPNFPNPFNGNTAISFTLARDEEVNLTLYASNGQRVMTLANRVFGVGRHVLTWDGRTAQGKALASGVYFYRLKTIGGMAVGKLVLNR